MTEEMARDEKMQLVKDIETLQELADPLLYIDRNLFIRSKRGEIIPFHLNPVQKYFQAQKEAAIAAGKPARFLVLKYRRGGISTLEQALSFHLTATKEGQEVATLAHDTDTTEKIFRISQLFYEKLPPEKRPRRLSKQNKRELNFPDLHSLFYVGTAGRRGFGRGDTFQRIHGSEVARWPGSPDEVDDLIAGICEACSEGEVVLETTAAGMGNWYHREWERAKKGDSEFTPIFLAWFMDPDNAIPLEEGEVVTPKNEEEMIVTRKYELTDEQLKWRQRKKKARGKLFSQEYPEDDITAFLTSGMLYFNATIIRGLVPQCMDPLPMESIPPDIRQGLTVWYLPKTAQKYWIGGDAAEGVDGGDPSGAGIIDADGRQCAVIRGHFRAEVLAEKLNKIGRWYNIASIAIEANGHGLTTLDRLRHKHHYPNLFFQRKMHRRQITRKMGWNTDQATRPRLLDDLREAVQGEHGMEVNDPQFLGECHTFADDGTGKFKARQGCYDDAIFYWGIAWQARIQGSVQPRIRILGQGLTEESSAAPKNSLDELGFTILSRGE